MSKGDLMMKGLGSSGPAQCAAKAHDELLAFDIIGKERQFCT